MPNHLWLYKSADFKIIITVSFDPLDGFWHSKCHFGVVFQGQFNGEVRSPMAVQISWLRQKYHHIFWSSGWILMFKGSFWGSFSRPIQWWGQITYDCTNQLTLDRNIKSWNLLFHSGGALVNWYLWPDDHGGPWAFWTPQNLWGMSVRNVLSSG